MGVMQRKYLKGLVITTLRNGLICKIQQGKNGVSLNKIRFNKLLT